MSEIQIDYTSRDFAGLKEDLIQLIKDRTGTSTWDTSDPSDLGAILVEAFAYMGDVMSYYIDRAANETAIDTAIKRSTLLNFANLYGYKPSGPTPATAVVTFTNDGVTSVDLPKGTQVMAPLSYSPYTEVYFETTTAVTALLPTQSIDVICQEGKTVNTDRPDLIDSVHNIALPANLGMSNGSADQVFQVFDTGIVDSSVVVYVGQGTSFSTWKYVESLVEYGPNSLVYTTVQNEDTTLSIVFGNGVNGAIPAANQLISTVYKTSTGIYGNIKSGLVKEVTFVPGNIDLNVISTLTVTNVTSASGGANGDDFTQLREKIKAAITTRKRAVTLKDYEALSSQVPQVGKVKAVSDVYSSVTMYLQSQDDTTSTPGSTLTTSTITGVSGSGTVITYTATNTLTPGDVVSISGVDPAAYNIVGTVATASGSQFTILGATTTSYVSGGVATQATPTTTWSAISDAISLYMADKVPVGTTLTIEPPVYVPIYIDVVVYAGDAYKASDIKLSVYKAYLGSDGFFNYANDTFGRVIPYSSVIYKAAAIDGVTSVNVTALNTTGASASAADITLADNQIPYLLPANLDITVIGGIQ
jgi:hypothetical protein